MCLKRTRDENEFEGSAESSQKEEGEEERARVVYDNAEP